MTCLSRPYRFTLLPTQLTFLFVNTICFHWVNMLLQRRLCCIADQTIVKFGKCIEIVLIREWKEKREERRKETCPFPHNGRGKVGTQGQRKDRGTEVEGDESTVGGRWGGTDRKPLILLLDVRLPSTFVGLEPGSVIHLPHSQRVLAMNESAGNKCLDLENGSSFRWGPALLSTD